jgi:hypothetical protein
VVDHFRALARESSKIDLIIRSEEMIRGRWPDLTPADREDLDGSTSRLPRTSNHLKWRKRNPAATLDAARVAVANIISTKA